MSTFYPYELRCGCGHVHTVDLVYGIHISRLPWARQQILDGTFQVFPCPGCGVPTRVTSQTVYTDFERNQYVAVEPGVSRRWPELRAMHDRIFENSFTNGPPIASEMGVRFRRRLVVGFPALREKLMIWDAGFDDLVVEAVKADLMRRLGLSPRDIVFRLGGVIPGGHLTFVRFEADRPAPIGEDGVYRGEVPAPVDVDTVLAVDYRARLEQRASITTDFPWLADDWMIDIHDGLDAVATASR